MFAVTRLATVPVNHVAIPRPIFPMERVGSFWQGQTLVLNVPTKELPVAVRMVSAMALARAKHILILLSAAQLFVWAVTREMHRLAKVEAVLFQHR